MATLGTTTAPLTTPSNTQLGKLRCLKYTLGEHGLFTKMYLYGQLGLGTITVHLGIYGDTDGEPNVLLRQITPVEITSTSAEWYEGILTSPLYLPAGDYWLAFYVDGVGMVSWAAWYNSTGSVERYKTLGLGATLPDPFPSDASVGDNLWSNYALYTPKKAQPWWSFK